MAGDLLAILSQASTSLGAHRAAAATASQNIANVNTPGYSRQTANLEALTPTDFAGNAFIGRGVGLQSITQARDLFLERQVPTAISNKGFSSTESDALAAVTAMDPDGGDGLTSALGTFYAAMRGASQNPNDPGLRQAAVSAAQTLTRAFNRTGQALEDTRNGVDAKLAGTVNDVNQTAAAMADLNKQIRIARASGGEPNDLLDARQRMQDKLTQLTGAVPVTNDKGDVSMALPGGTALVSDDRAATLSVTPDASNGGHLALQLTRTDGSGPVTLAGTAVGGSMGGAISARDGAILTAKNSIDTLAFDLGNTINAVHSAGFAADGTTGHQMFTVAATAAGAASSITVDAGLLANPSLLAAASAPGASGDNRNLLAIINTERTALSTGNDAATTFQGIVTSFGSAAQRSSAVAGQDAGIADHLDQLRESASGVSLDEEMINMTKAQRAFEAVSKVITATSAMLDTLMSLK
ncbi:MAG: flagellar hook-associated protein 1 [Myxococcales bacterium]|jgi:flagellar hook-associated protein 1 FlgK|nr:flagellar hook-associated protein 1 [Myxococcales bacterium]